MGSEDALEEWEGSGEELTEAIIMSVLMMRMLNTRRLG